jgi:methionyl-tRNA synthetase
MSKFYLTTSIAYVNAAPHLGFALELIQADAVARYRRQQGDNVFFLTGTDEHGAKIVRAAEAANKDPQTFVDQNAVKFLALKELLNISWTDFIRTSDQQKHWPQVIDLWEKLAAAGDIYKKNYRGLYCVGHEAFVTEKDLLAPSGVEGIGKCKDHNTEPEVIEEENYFFRLSKYAQNIELGIKNKELRIIPESRANEILNFIKEGIEDISFSRPRKDLQWGIPVPDDDSQTIYVWADALANYLYLKDRWPADLHCIGKDILRFHALYWPAMLLSVGLPLPKQIFVHGHITVNSQKMSKTLGNVVDPVELVRKYGADAVRYFLLREIPPTDDGDFSYEKFEERYNGDLANGLGNFAARVLKLASRDVNSIRIHATDANFDRLIATTKKTVSEKMEGYKFHEALATIWELINFGDKYLDEKKPWTITESDSADKSIIKKETIFNCLYLLKEIAILLEPFLPETSQKINKSITSGEKPILFPRI